MAMTRVQWQVTACAVAGLAAALLSTGTAIAAGTPQQNCDKARLLAWGGYVGCMEKAKIGLFLGKDSAKDRASWRCRHRYFSKWTAFQTRVGLGGSTCAGARFTNNGETVTDNLTGLEWEKKAYAIDPTLHDWTYTYDWSSGTPGDGTGDAFTYFLNHVNLEELGGSMGWRLPTVPELASIVLDYPCVDEWCDCHLNSCIDQTVFGPTQSDVYWSATPSAGNPSDVWGLSLDGAGIGSLWKSVDAYVRAVRGGL
jgi:hypothetical protein